MSKEHLRIGELLVEKKLLGRADLEQALREQAVNHRFLGLILMEKGLVSKEKLDEALAVQRERFENVSLARLEIDPEVVKIIPERLANRFLTIAVGREKKALRAVMADPGDIIALDTLRSLTGFEIKPLKGRGEEILAAIKKYYYGYENDAAEAVLEITGERQDTEIRFQADDPPVIKFVNLMLVQALERRASDIHLEPREKSVSMRLRVDGALVSALPPSLQMQPGIVSRIKIMSGLDIAERRKPQDGRCEVRIGQKALDLRISTFPTVFGEKVVIRVLDRSGLVVDLQELGMEINQLKQFQASLRKPYGIILISGPTGAGKTTTLYAALSALNLPDRNIVTIEDPVEYRIEGINQAQIRPEIGLNFASYLRHVLRQDPNIIMIGEIRDYETAEIAVRAALTGHLVLSTIHTNNSIATLSRLTDMGIQPYLIGPALNLVVSQRLLRRLCPECKKPAPPSPLLPDGASAYAPVGCSFCNMTGYWSRIGIYEVLSLNQEIQELVVKGREEGAIREAALRHGFKALYETALTKVCQGVTSLDEVLGTVEGNGDDED